MASTLVDDSDYHVQYQPGWIWEQGVAEVRATRHGAAIPGLRAWLPFTGTGVRVVGTLGPSDTYGQPRTTYLLDGAVAGTYAAPRTAQVRYNVTFFEARNLEPGDHIITVNNTDGAPHTFWLDYILIDPEPEEEGGQGRVTSTTTSTATTKGTGPTPDPDPDPPAREPSHSSSSSTVSSRPSSSSGPTSTTSSTASSGSRSLTVTPNASATPNAFSSGAGNSTTSVSLVTSGSGDATVVSTVSVTLPLGAAAQTSAANTNSDVGGAGSGSDGESQGESHSDAGVIAGAAVAGIAVVAIVAVVYLFLRRRRRPRKAPDTVPQFTYASDNRGATLPTESRSHQPDAVSPSEMTHGSVESLSESYTPSPSSSSALLVPMRQSSPPLPPVPPPPPPPPVSEKSAQSTSSPDTPYSGFSTDSSTRLESTHSSDMVESGPASNSRASSASLSTLMPAAAVLPPGAWHAPPDAHGRAQTLLRSLFSRGARAERGEDMVTVSRDVDSGLRLYDEVVLPPPYTQD